MSFISKIFLKQSFSFTTLEVVSKSLKNVRLDFLKFCGNEVVQIPEDKLKVGYESLRNRLSDLTFNISVTSYVSSIFSSVFLTLTETSLLESPTCMLALGVGGGLVVKQSVEAYRIKKYAALSVVSNPVGPATCETINDKILRIIAGSNPRVNFSRSGMEVIGPLGDINHPSLAREKALDYIRSMKAVTLPSCVFGKRVDGLASQINRSFISSVTAPFSGFYALTNLGSSSRGLLKSVLLGASTYNLYNYFVAESLSEVRKKVFAYLEKGNTPEEVMKLIVDGNDLQEGMSFLYPWLDGSQIIGVKVDLLGQVTLHKTPSPSVEVFPRDRVYEKVEENHLFHILGVLSIAGLAGVVLSSRKKREL